jgi:hypothetical protein
MRENLDAREPPVPKGLSSLHGIVKPQKVVWAGVRHSPGKEKLQRAGISSSWECLACFVISRRISSLPWTSLGRAETIPTHAHGSFE